jgi:hypothetical protein
MTTVKQADWATEDHILTKVKMVLKDGSNFASLSTGERIAVAMVLDRKDLLDRCWGTMLESVYRLGPQWTEAALSVQRNWVDVRLQQVVVDEHG